MTQAQTAMNANFVNYELHVIDKIFLLLLVLLSNSLKKNACYEHS